mgnify:CR=1 FL=1
MVSGRETRRNGRVARWLPYGGVLLLFILLTTPGDAAPGAGAVHVHRTIALQQALATELVGLDQGRCNCVHIPDWLLPRSPCRPPWFPRPPAWIPGPPPWVPHRPVWVPWLPRRGR